ncbi:MAG: RluA family pseudouridine synthase [Candidatus Binatia bacterium]
MDENKAFSKLGAARTLQWLVTTEEDALRLDSFLARRLATFSRRECTALIAERHVLLNGRPAPKGVKVQARDFISVSLSFAAAALSTLPVTIEYSDDSIIIVNKPSGLPSVALRHTDAPTVANFLSAQFPETVEAGPRPLEAGLVHRLDTDTSGLLLAARTPAAYTALREQFHSRSVGKHYLAIVKGALKGQGQITQRLEPTGPRGQRMRLSTAERGQEACTRYVSTELLPHHTVIHLTISTGVRHQIRVHLATVGHPLVGDKMYGETDQLVARLCLHAETLTFRHPTTGQKFSYTSPLPEDFSLVLEQLRSTSTPET